MLGLYSLFHFIINRDIASLYLSCYVFCMCFVSSFLMNEYIASYLRQLLFPNHPQIINLNSSIIALSCLSLFAFTWSFLKKEKTEKFINIIFKVSIALCLGFFLMSLVGFLREYWRVFLLRCGQYTHKTMQINRQWPHCAQPWRARPKHMCSNPYV